MVQPTNDDSRLLTARLVASTSHLRARSLRLRSDDAFRNGKRSQAPLRAPTIELSLNDRGLFPGVFEVANPQSAIHSPQAAMKMNFNFIFFLTPSS